MTAFRRNLLIVLFALAIFGAAPGALSAQAWPKRWPVAQDPPPEQEQEPAEPEAEPEEPVEEEAPAEEEPEAEPEPSPFLAIVGGDVHTVTSGLLAGATVLIEEDKVVSVGTNVSVPEGARIIDASGMQVYPGLVAVSSSGLISGGKDLLDSFDPFSLNVDLGLAGGLTTVETGGAVGKLTRGTLEGALLSKQAWIQLNYSTTAPASRRRLREGLEKARNYVRDVKEFELAKERGSEEEAPSDRGIDKNHVKLLRGQATARFNANSLKDLLSIADLLEEFPMSAVIYGGQEAWACAARLGRTGARLVITPRGKNWADDRLNRPSGWTIENARNLHDAGVEFAIIPTQPFISTGGIAGRDLLTLPLEAAFAIRGGLSQDAALRAITLDAAKILGVQDRVGSLETGKDADLIICDGDLFDYRTFVQWAVVNGRIAYDKQTAPYFAHIRPRPEPTPQEVVESLLAPQESAEDGTAEEAEEGQEEPVEVDAPEGGN